MFAYLEGKIDSKGQNEVILDVQGVGFELNCSMNTTEWISASTSTSREGMV